MSTTDTAPTDRPSGRELAEQARRWIADDPDATTAQELRDLLDLADRRVPEGDDPAARIERMDIDAARRELADRFDGTLQFGTAGLRGALGAGPNRMNRAVVIRAAAGLARYLQDTVGAAAGGAPRIVIGYDARHGSAAFARDTAAVMVAAGVDSALLPEPLPTPVLAFAVRHLGADAGVMVTASHNPARDNGYKVYLGGRAATGAGQGAQIVPPADAEIAARIAAVPSVAAVRRADAGWTVLTSSVVDDYVTAVTGLATPGGPRDLRIVLTPLHGVGGAVVERVLRAAGFTDLHVVAEQAAPDPDFPTVAFPNPEEPGAMDLALGLAQTVRADLVIANDPDADRCAVAVVDLRARTHHGPDTAAAEGWRALHGDEIGALLGAHLADRAAAGGGGRSAGTATPAPVLASSIVSSRLLGRIAAAHGLGHASTLTGFKWIARTEGLAYGYEEALGYCVAPGLVRDKDGISAALLLAELAADLRAAGRTLVGALDDLAREHGLHLTDQLSARFADLAQIGATMARVRQSPPTTLAGSPVTEVVDLSDGVDGLPPTDGIRLLAADGSRVVVRPSGTEPKVKCYLEVVLPVSPTADDDALTQARVAARDRLDALRADLSDALGLDPA
ncbi:phospho-sugar mutase [Cellulomonas sp. ATA003]|uniref:phospho-sugar mutase n=1 Tax=Cellulomonas sp. ATA003 TaxID=3073064 RepID=UPI00287310D6|nr:phospho-sugar mutase [Cellulomonas sp. ATA003]WNB84987.1 phospho-sugar mutase [Cellulomonas sp. ATA003]